MKDDRPDDVPPPPRRPRPPQREDDEERPAPKKAKRTPATDDRDDNDRPAPKKAKTKGSKKGVIFLVAGAVGLLVLVAVGVGAWLLFFSGGERIGKPAAPRELAKADFAYAIGDSSDLTLFDNDMRSTEGGREEAVGMTILQTTPLPAAGVARVVVYQSQTQGAGQVTTFHLKAPADLSEWAKAQPEWETKAVAGKTVYSRKAAAEAVFQPNPTTLVKIVRGGFGPDWKYVETVASRDPAGFSVTPDAWELARLVSGYSRSTVGPGQLGEFMSPNTPALRATGTRRSAAGMESYSVLSFSTDSHAKSILADLRKKWNEMDAKGDKSRKPDRYMWATGKNVHILTITPMP